MQPDDKRNYPFPSYPRALPPPLHDPDADPKRTVSINCDWLKFIRGSLVQLIQQTTWDVPNEAALLLAQQRAMTLISMITECNPADLPFACPYNFAGDPQSFVETNTALGPGPVTAVWSALDEAWTYTDHDAGGGHYARACDITKVFASPVHINHSEFTYDLAAGTFTGGLGSGIVLYDSSVSVVGSHIVGAASLPTGFNQLWTLDGDFPNVKYMRFIVTVSDDFSGCSSCSGNCFIRLAEASGIGSATCM